MHILNFSLHDLNETNAEEMQEKLLERSPDSASVPNCITPTAA